jgi:hypothetical protein
MNTARLTNLIPTLVVISFLGYLGYSVQPSIPGSVDPPQRTMIAESVGTKNDVEPRTNRAESRDPFQLGSKPDVVAEDAQNAQTAPTTIGHERVAEIVLGLKLEATFVQSHNQSAIIDGRIYRQGQQVELEGFSEDPLSRLIVARVMPTKVILQDRGQSYELKYSDQIGPRSNDLPKAQRDRSPDATVMEPDSGEPIAQLQSLLLNTIGMGGNRNAARGSPSLSKRSAARQPRSR